MRISEHCYAATGFGYAPPWCVNAGIITGRDATLIVDTGANALAAATIHGYATATAPANRILAINTERHFDHIGGNGWFRARSIDVHGHGEVSRTPSEFASDQAEFNDHILDPVRRARREAEAFYAGTELALPNRILEAETAFDLGGITAEILFTPGHTPANICVWVPAGRVLFTGDTLINGYLPNLDSGNPAAWRQWLEALDRIARLAPNAVVPGHGHVATGSDVDALIDRVRAVLTTAIATGRSPTAA